MYHDYGGKVLVISIRELSWVVNRAPRNRRHILLFTFHCDESYDSPKQKLPPGSPPFEPTTYTVAGFFGDEKTWTRVERRWGNANSRFKVPRYHASHLNAKTYEYEGWSDSQKIKYGKQMLKILKDQKRKLHAVSCGLLADEYRRIVNEKGRENLGTPYLLCFKSCLTIIAKEMEDFPPEDQFAVVLDQNDFQTEAVKLFYDLKNDPGFVYRSRLATCTPAASEEVVVLQTADLIAYETFRLLHGRRQNPDMEIRKVLKLMFDTNGFSGYYYGGDTLQQIKQPAESATCRPNGFFVIMPTVEENIRRGGKYDPVVK